MFKYLKQSLDNSNSKGVPVPLVRYKGKGDVALTLVFLSFNVVLLGTIGKISRFLGDVDLSQALTLFGICCGLFFGVNFKRDTTELNHVSISKEPEPPKEC